MSYTDPKNLQIWDDEKPSGTGDHRYPVSHNGASYRLELAKSGCVRVIVRCRPGVANDGMGNSEWVAGYVQLHRAEGEMFESYAAFDRESGFQRGGFGHLEDAADYLIDEFPFQEWILR